MSFSSDYLKASVWVLHKSLMPVRLESIGLYTQVQTIPNFAPTGSWQRNAVSTRSREVISGMA
jgi:hypothetical protein